MFTISTLIYCFYFILFEDEKWKTYLKENNLLCLVKMQNPGDAAERKTCCTNARKYFDELLKSIYYRFAFFSLNHVLKHLSIEHRSFCKNMAGSS
jgi:hypothetical protein